MYMSHLLLYTGEKEQEDSAVADAAQATTIQEEAKEAESKAEPVEESSAPAAVTSKEDDLERTTQVIMDYVNSQVVEDGVVDDDDE